MLDNNIKNQLKSHFESLKHPVELLIALDDSKKSSEVESLANDLASLSEAITVSTNSDLNARRPSMVVHSPDKNTHITFAGVPMGHEFTTGSEEQGMSSLSLGQTTEYPEEYAPGVLFPIARAKARDELGLGARLPFRGVDIWNAWTLLNHG